MININTYTNLLYLHLSQNFLYGCCSGLLQTDIYASGKGVGELGAERTTPRLWASSWKLWCSLEGGVGVSIIEACCFFSFLCLKKGENKVFGETNKPIPRSPHGGT